MKLTRLLACTRLTGCACMVEAEVHRLTFLANRQACRISPIKDCDSASYADPVDIVIAGRGLVAK